MSFRSWSGLVGDLDGRLLLPVEGVEPAQVIGCRLAGQLVVHVIEKVLDRLLAFVAELDAGAGAERHREVGVHRGRERPLGAAPRAEHHAQRQRHVMRARGVPGPEEITQRRPDAGIVLAVPEHLQDQLPQVLRCVTPRGHPDVLDDASAVQISHHVGVSGRDGREVPVTAGPVPGGGAGGPPLLDVRQPAERAVRNPESHDAAPPPLACRTSGRAAGARSRMSGVHPFTAPSVMPETMCRCRSRASSTTGIE